MAHFDYLVLCEVYIQLSYIHREILPDVTFITVCMYISDV